MAFLTYETNKSHKATSFLPWKGPNPQQRFVCVKLWQDLKRPRAPWLRLCATTHNEPMASDEMNERWKERNVRLLRGQQGLCNPPVLVCSLNLDYRIYGFLPTSVFSCFGTCLSGSQHLDLSRLPQGRLWGSRTVNRVPSSIDKNTPRIET